MRVNGRDIEVVERLTLADFLRLQQYNLKNIAVERNGEIVPKATYQDVLLKEEDRLEIVQFVGGG